MPAPMPATHLPTGSPAPLPTNALSSHPLPRTRLRSGTASSSTRARRPSDRTPDPAAAENPAPIPTPPPVTGRLAEAGPGYATADTGSPAVSNQHSQFFKRLSPEVGRDIVYLKVSGHYVEVTASGGSDMILMRLADAVDALGGLGMQVHRSYWASFKHMQRLVRREGRMLLRLTDGREVPVSRPYLKAVRAVLPRKPAHSPSSG